MEFWVVETAKEWGLTPSQFKALPAEDRMLMLGYERVKGKMEAYSQGEQDRQAHRQKSKRGKR